MTVFRIILNGSSLGDYEAADVSEAIEQAAPGICWNRNSVIAVRITERPRLGFFWRLRAIFTSP